MGTAKLPIPVIGDEFGGWKVIGPRKGQYIVCRCRCGKEKPVRISYLHGERSTKCFACARKEANRIRNEAAKVQPEIRFWAMVNKDGPVINERLGKCWQWLGKPLDSGYGQINVGKRKNVRAHRYSWQLHHGTMPTLCVLHKCDNPLCVNPEHLFLGTRQDNVEDRDSKGRQAKGERSGRRTQPEQTARGSRHGRYGNPHQSGIGANNGNAKLDEETVLRILKTYRRGSRSHGGPALARECKVSQGIISGIVSGKLWKHVYAKWIEMGRAT